MNEEQQKILDRIIERRFPAYHVDGRIDDNGYLCSLLHGDFYDRYVNNLLGSVVIHGPKRRHWLTGEKNDYEFDAVLADGEWWVKAGCRRLPFDVYYARAWKARYLGDSPDVRRCGRYTEEVLDELMDKVIAWEIKRIKRLGADAIYPPTDPEIINSPEETQ